MRGLLVILSIYSYIAADVWANIIDKRNAFRPDFTYVDEIDGWYKFHAEPARWSEAELMCHVEGGVLQSPVDEHHKSAMVAAITSNIENDGIIFTGIHAIFSPGDFRTIEGTRLSDIPYKWAPNEPDNHKNKEACLVLLQDGTLADVRCNDQYPYICYKKYDPKLVASKCGTVDKGYKFKSKTGHCYKFHSRLASWELAHKICEAERAKLAIINSKNESDIIQELYSDYKQSEGHERFDQSDNLFTKTLAHIGFKALGENSLWVTIDGKPLEEAGFSTFADGYNKYETESCGSINLYGELNGIECSKLAPFICEMIPIYNNEV